MIFRFDWKIILHRFYVSVVHDRPNVRRLHTEATNWAHTSGIGLVLVHHWIFPHNNQKTIRLANKKVDETVIIALRNYRRAHTGRASENTVGVRPACGGCSTENVVWSFTLRAPSLSHFHLWLHITYSISHRIAHTTRTPATIINIYFRPCRRDATLRCGVIICRPSALWWWISLTPWLFHAHTLKKRSSCPLFRSRRTRSSFSENSPCKSCCSFYVSVNEIYARPLIFIYLVRIFIGCSALCGIRF